MNRDDWGVLVDVTMSRIHWTAAKKWLCVWAGAGYPAKLRDNSIVFPKGWQEKFPDGAELCRALKKEMSELLKDGNGAVLNDEKLQVNYERYLLGRIADAERRQRHATRYSDRLSDAQPADPELQTSLTDYVKRLGLQVETLKKELATLKPKADVV